MIKSPCMKIIGTSMKHIYFVNDSMLQYCIHEFLPSRTEIEYENGKMLNSRYILSNGFCK